MPLERTFELALQQQLPDALLHDIGLGDIERAHAKATYPALGVHLGGPPRPPLVGMDDIHLVPLVAKLAHQVCINAPGLDMGKAR